MKNQNKLKCADVVLEPEAGRPFAKLLGTHICTFEIKFLVAFSHKAKGDDRHFFEVEFCSFQVKMLKNSLQLSSTQFRTCCCSLFL